MDENKRSSFLTEEEILREFEGVEGEMARHLLAQRQPTDATLEQRIAAIAVAEPLPRSDAAPGNVGLIRRVGTISGQMLRLAAILLLALGVWGLFRVTLAPPAQPSTASAPPLLAPAASPEELARAFVRAQYGEEALSGFRVLAEEPLGTGTVLLFTFLMPAESGTALYLPAMVLYAEQRAEGWFWQEGGDLAHAVEAALNRGLDTSPGWVPIGHAYAFYGVVRQPEIVRVEVVEADGGRFIAEMTASEGPEGFLFLRDGAEGAPPPPVAIRAYDENNSELLLLEGRMTPTANADAEISPLPFFTPTFVPTATPLPLATGTPTPAAPPTPPGAIPTHTLPAAPPTSVPTSTPWPIPSASPWGAPSMTPLPPPTSSPISGDPPTPWLTPTPWDGADGPPTPPADWLTPTPWDGADGPPTPPPDWFTPTPVP